MVQKPLAYARLLRLSNGPTAVADVWMGYAVVSGILAPDLAVVLASLASLAAYHGGMALNDAVDAVEDEADGRGRPIAQGLLSRRAAYVVACGGLLASFVATLSLCWINRDAQIACIGLMLVLSIIAYNSSLKSGWAGPLLMGVCRLLNVMLGVFAVSYERLANLTVYERGKMFALLIGVYTAGVTLFARDEAHGAGRSRLLAGCAISSSTFVAFALVSQFDHVNVVAWTAAGLLATRGMAAAILQPTPKNIGRGVGIAIQGLVVIDATLAAFYAGPVAGLAILALLPLTMLLARWIPQT